MKVRQVLQTLSCPERTLVFIDRSQKGYPRTDYVQWLLGDRTDYDDRDVSSVLYGRDAVEIRLA